MSPPTFEFPDNNNKSNIDDPLDSLKETGTFTNPAIKEKLKKYENNRKSSNKSKKKHHSR